MLVAFLDDADSFKDPGSLCLAGYVSDQYGWTALSKEWATLLGKHQIPYLRTSDFLAGSPHYTPGKPENEDRLIIIRDFLEVISRNVLFGVSIGVDAKAYKELAARERKKPTAERFCFYRLLHRVISRSAQLAPEMHLSLFFGDAAEYSIKFSSALHDFKTRKRAIRNTVASISFANAAMLLPLQAANLLATLTSHEMRKSNLAWFDCPFGELSAIYDPCNQFYEREHWDRNTIIKFMSSIIAAVTRD
jgi:hypothetical protein